MTEAGLQHGLGHAGSGDKLIIAERGQIRTASPQRNGVQRKRVGFGIGLGRKHPADMAQGLLHQIGTFVVPMRHVRGDIGMIAKECQIELLERDRRASNALHAQVRKIEEEVATEETNNLGQL